MKDEGFTLVEVVVALVILVLIGGIVMSSFNAILSVRTRLGAYLEASEAPTLVAGWFRDSVGGLIAQPGKGDDRFTAQRRRLSGLSVAPIAGHAGVPTTVTWSLSFDEAAGRTYLHYAAGDDPPMAVASWPGDRGRFAYCDAELACGDTWPPPGAANASQLPIVVQLVAVRGRRPWPILAAPRAARDPAPNQ
jgi:prepilin-type N-terminal cleavage/methylation domain-containing protein